MPRKHRAGKARKARAQINLAIKQEYQLQRRKALTAPCIIKDILLDPPIPRAIIEAIKQRPVHEPIMTLAHHEYFDTTDPTLDIDGQAQIAFLESDDINDALTEKNSPPPSIEDFDSPASVEIIDEIIT